MNDFEKCFNKVIEHEGYYANVKGDKGGETYMGIARNIHPTWGGWQIVDRYQENRAPLKRNEKINGSVIQSLVEKFYFETYWIKNGIHLIENFNLKYIIFDWCVNSGIYGAKHVQRIVGAKVDGIIGNQTATLINAHTPEYLFFKIKQSRIEYYNKIAVGQNKQFLKGWLKRINSIDYEQYSNT